MAYNLLLPIHLINAASMGANITSNIVEIKEQDNVGIQLNWTTSNAVGTFDVQVSVDHQQDSLGNVTIAGTWISLALNPQITAASVNDSAYIELNQVSAPYLRVVYTRTSGIGTLDAFVTGKGV